MLYTIVPQAKLPRNMLGIFTYTGEDSYAAGDVVIVEFRKRKVFGLVVSESREKNLTPVIKPVQKKIARAPAYILPLIRWMAEYYFASPAFIWDAISPAPIKKKISQPLSPSIPFFSAQNARIHSSKLPLNILDSNHNTATNTYHYDTATKYTHYIQLISDTWEKGACAMFLAPTISDITAFVQFLPANWEERTIVFSSELYKSKHRYCHAWERVLKTFTPLLLVGTRSATFAPTHKLGLIIIDKAQSDDYKQYDQNPRYDARIVAWKIGELTECAVKMFSDGVVVC